jgi:hypothetical protein
MAPKMQLNSGCNCPSADGAIPGTGHFHVLVDLPAMAEGEPIPFDDAHKHYGKGQTAADIELAPVSGQHVGLCCVPQCMHNVHCCCTACLQAS